jgi:hypothetical protein
MNVPTDVVLFQERFVIASIDEDFIVSTIRSHLHGCNPHAIPWTGWVSNTPWNRHLSQMNFTR